MPQTKHLGIRAKHILNLVCKSLRRDLGGGRSSGQCLKRNPVKAVNISQGQKLNMTEYISENIPYPNSSSNPLSSPVAVTELQSI